MCHFIHFSSIQHTIRHSCQGKESYKGSFQSRTIQPAARESLTLSRVCSLAHPISRWLSWRVFASGDMLAHSGAKLLHSCCGSHVGSLAWLLQSLRRYKVSVESASDSPQLESDAENTTLRGQPSSTLINPLCILIYPGPSKTRPRWSSSL